MQLQEFIDKHYDGGDVYSADPNINFTCVEQGDEEICGKFVTKARVYHLDGTNDHFEVTEIWSNSEYDRDCEHYDQFRKVKPLTEMVPVTRWVDAD